MDDVDDDDCGSKDSWDGDVLANLGMGFLQVQGENQGVPLQDQGVALLLNRGWQVQGHHGTNSVKAKKMVSPSFRGDAFTWDKKETEPAQILTKKPAWIVESCL